MKTFTFYLLLLLGASLVGIAATPLVFAFPSSDSGNSGPRNVWELILMISYDSWIWLSLAGLCLLAISIFSLRRLAGDGSDK